TAMNDPGVNHSRSHATLLWLGVLLLLAGFLLVAWRLLDLRFQAGKGLPPYSLYSEQDNGLAESAHLLRQLGWEPVPLTRPVMGGLQRGLLLVVEPGEDEFGDADARALLRW